MSEAVKKIAENRKEFIDYEFERDLIVGCIRENSLDGWYNNNLSVELLERSNYVPIYNHDKEIVDYKRADNDESVDWAIIMQEILDYADNNNGKLPSEQELFIWYGKDDEYSKKVLDSLALYDKDRCISADKCAEGIRARYAQMLGLKFFNTIFREGFMKDPSYENQLYLIDQWKNGLKENEYLIMPDSEDEVDEFEFHNFQKWLYLPPEERISCGFPEIDEKLIGGGIVKDYSLTVFLAGTGVGKSWILCRLAKILSEKGLNILFYSPEMPRRQIFSRIGSIVVKRNFGDVIADQNKTIVEKEINERFADSGKLYCFGADDIHNFTFDEIIRRIKQCKADVLIIDDISYITPDYNKGLQEYQRIAQTCKELMKLSQKNRIPVFSSSQATRDGNKTQEAPDITQIAGSFGIARQSTTVFSMGHDSEKRLEIRFLKNRDGFVGESGVSDIVKYKVDYDTHTYTYIPPEEDFSDLDDTQAKTESTKPKKEFKAHFKNKQPLTRKTIDADQDIVF